MTYYLQIILYKTFFPIKLTPLIQVRIKIPQQNSRRFKVTAQAIKI